MHAAWASFAVFACAILSMATAASASFARTVPMKRNHFDAIVIKEAHANHINPRLLSAIIEVESGWNPAAMHLETNYRYLRNVANFAHKTHVTVETERYLQRMAFGLCQIVGGTARAIGYEGPLAKLLDPAVNIHWGAIYLGGLRERYPANERAQAAAYNAGSAWVKKGRYINQPYVDMVMGAMQRTK